MSRITDSILQKGQAYAGAASPLMNLRYGGTQGPLPLLGKVGPDGRHYDEWISNQNYVRRNIIAVVLRYPAFMDFMPNPEQWIASYIAIMERHPTTIDGLNSTIVLEQGSTTLSSGQIMEETVGSTLTPSELVNTYKEKANKSITKFWEQVSRYGSMDPYMKSPLVSKFLNAQQIGGIYTREFNSGVMLYFEPDILNQTVVDAWLLYNVENKSVGERVGKSDPNSPGELVDISIPFSSITLSNDRVMELAQIKLTAMSLFSVDPSTDTVLPNTENNAIIDQLR